MASVNMNEQRTSVDDEKSEKAWYYEQTKSTPGNGAWILKPNGTLGMGVTFVPTLGSGSVEATTDSIDKCNAGTAVGVAWDFGTVSGTTQDSAVQLTAVRQVNISGSTVIKVVAQ